MRAHPFGVFLILMATSLMAAERVFIFETGDPGEPPAGFQSEVVGAGTNGVWKVLTNTLPEPVSNVATSAPVPVTPAPVLAQVSQQPVAGRYPILIYDRENYGDFKFSARVKIVAGTLEQMAGLVFRYQNESNFYAVGFSSKDAAFRCYKVLNGQWKSPLGSSQEASLGSWHEIVVQCEGTRITCSLDGKPVIKFIDAMSEPAGLVGFWTRADATANFTDAKISFEIPETLARKLVRDASKQYPRVMGLRIYATPPNGTQPVIVASKDESELGQAAGDTELAVIRQNMTYFGKDNEAAYVTLPLCDRNGDPVAAVCVILKAGFGQTQDNAVMRARPIQRDMQARVLSLDELVR